MMRHDIELEPWFLGDGRIDDEMRFLAALRDRAASWDALDVRRDDTQAWDDDDQVFYVHVDLAGPENSGIYGTMRVDYDGQRVMGHWGSACFCDEIDLTKPDTFASPIVSSPEEAAAYAADWLEVQLRRPVELREWSVDGDVVYRLWLLTDDDHGLSMQYGPRSRVTGPPTRVVSLRPDRR